MTRNEGKTPESTEQATVQYEAPEVLELGSAESLTLGQANYKYVDNCQCSQYSV